MSTESKTPSFDAAHVVEDSGGGDDSSGGAAPAVAEAPAPVDHAPASRGDGSQPRAPDGKWAPKNADGSDKSPAQIEAEGRDGQQRVDTVPYSALLKERAELKRIKDELRERDARHARLESRLDLIQQGWQPQQQQKPEEPGDDLGPDPELDPIGSAKWLREQRAADMRARKEWQAQQNQQSQAQQAQHREWEEFNNDLAASNQVWDETVAQVPEMNQVLDGLRASFRLELETAGWAGQQLIQKMNEMEKMHAVHAHRTGRHVGEYFAQLAKARNVPFPQRRQAQAQNGNGQPQPAPQGQQHPAAPDPATANIKQLAAAQAASQTLSGTGGSPGTGKIDLAALDRMDDDELRQFIRLKNDRDPGGFERWKKTQMVGA